MQSVDKGAFAHYTQQYQQLFHDQHLFSGFQATLWGMLASGGCKISQVAATSPLTTCTRHSKRRIRRLVHDGNKRASLEADSISKRFTSIGAQRLAGADEVLVILDESDLRKPHSSHLEHLDRVRSLTGTSVHGYHTLTALGTGPDGTRALLYHTSFSTQTHDFKSKNTEYRKAIKQVADALKTQGVGRVLWVLDRGFDMIDLLKYLDQQGQKFVVRLAYLDRRVKSDFKQPARPVLEVLKDAPLLATMQVSRLLFDEKAKRRLDVQVQVYGQQVFLPDATTLPLTAVRVDAGTKVEGWVLFSNLRFPDTAWKDRVELVRKMVLVYRQRFSIEDVFAWTKGALDWESVRVLDYQALRVVVAFSWIAAAFVFELGGELEDDEVLLLAELGGWRRGKKPPGKRAMALGLERMSVYLSVCSTLTDPVRSRELVALAAKLFGSVGHLPTTNNAP